MNAEQALRKQLQERSDFYIGKATGGRLSVALIRSGSTVPRWRKPRLFPFVRVSRGAICRSQTMLVRRQIWISRAAQFIEISKNNVIEACRGLSFTNEPQR